jgi:ubiquitin carboxyl-terminal hydrolase 34
MKSPVAPDRPHGHLDLSVDNNSAGSQAASVTEPGESPDTAAVSASGGPAQVSEAISLASSPAQSVEIEVAEVEDMDQDPSMSHWRSLQDALRARDDPGVVTIQEQYSLAESFPRLRRNADLKDSVEDIRKMLEKGSRHSSP